MKQNKRISKYQFRLGSYFYDYKNSEFSNIGSISSNFYGEYINGEPFDNVKPIEITIDILKNWCHFETYEYRATGDFCVVGVKIIRIGDYNYKIKVYANDDWLWNISYITNPYDSNIEIQKESKLTLTPIKYLHELQNWWQLLTGKELEINYEK